MKVTLLMLILKKLEGCYCLFDCCLNPSDHAMKKQSVPPPSPCVEAPHVYHILRKTRKPRSNVLTNLIEKCRFRWNPVNHGSNQQKSQHIYRNDYLDAPTKKLYPRYYSSRCCFLNSNLSVKTLDVEGTNINVLRPFDQLHDPIRVWKM